MPKVSVCVPIYNVEKYIEKCARSLFEQTLDDIEYIFINDCTPDNSIKVLETTLLDYPQRKQQVRIINFDKNKGAAKAREVGMKIATGEYIIHCDSDDWVATNAYELLYAHAVKSNSDMVICDWFETDGETNKHYIQKNISQSVTKQKILQGLINRSISASLWNRMVRRSVIQLNNIIYPSEHMMEDVALSIQETFFCSKIEYIPIPLYYYFSNENSICRKPGIQESLNRYHQACSNIDIVIQFLQDNLATYQYSNEIIILKQYARSFIWRLLLQDPASYYKLWMNTYPEVNYKYLLTKGVPIRSKIIFFLTLIKISPILYRLLKKYKK